MQRKCVYVLIIAITAAISIAFKNSSSPDLYVSAYDSRLNNFNVLQEQLLACIDSCDLSSTADVQKLKDKIQVTRNGLKKVDYWFRYLEPTMYKRVNGPLPVEWETEVFEKFEKPYKREGAGLTLAALYLDEEHPVKDSLKELIKASLDAMTTYKADSVRDQLTSYHHFFLCNRLYLLNLAAIYTTGFENPDPAQVVPELRLMMADVNEVYRAFNTSFPATSLTPEYMGVYAKAIQFVNEQPDDNEKFDHFSFIRDYINPLFVINQKLVLEYKVVSKSLIDYSLNKNSPSIFNKALYNGQNPKGIFLRVKDEATLAEIDRLGKLLFYDPILSGNNMRSCASCHKPTEYFTDTMVQTAFHFDHKQFLPRNTPSLLNAQYNHLIMLDGKEISLQQQTKSVIGNPIEMGCSEKEVLEKVLSCKEYRDAFNKLLPNTPTKTEITYEHIVSAITYYYSKFSRYYAPFDDAMNNGKEMNASVKHGFNLFMSKAQCATCHFVPQFNGVKPPYIGSEFEVLGVPRDTGFRQLSPDKGRYEVNPAGETMNAFRTGTVRNAKYTAPYMHNGVFKTLDEVVDFYNAGGGAGRGLKVDNQTLSSDSLKLTKAEKNDLIAFISSLNEQMEFEAPPQKLPTSKNKLLNARKVGGTY